MGLETTAICPHGKPDWEVCNQCNEGIPSYLLQTISKQDSYFPLLIRLPTAQHLIVTTPDTLPFGTAFTIIETRFVPELRICRSAQHDTDLSVLPPRVLCDEDRQKVHHVFTSGS